MDTCVSPRRDTFFCYGHLCFAPLVLALQVLTTIVLALHVLIVRIVPVMGNPYRYNCTVPVQLYTCTDTSPVPQWPAGHLDKLDGHRHTLHDGLQVQNERDYRRRARCGEGRARDQGPTSCSSLRCSGSAAVSSKASSSASSQSSFAASVIKNSSRRRESSSSAPVKASVGIAEVCALSDGRLRAYYSKTPKIYRYNIVYAGRRYCRP